MRKILFMMLLVTTALLNSIYAFCQYSIAGRLIDKESKLPVEGGVISSNNLSATTDPLGFFSIPSIDTLATIIIKCIGYKRVELSMNSSELKTIELSPIQFDLSSVIIYSSSHENYVKNITKLDLAARPVRSSQDILRLVPGLFIAQHAGGGKAEQIFLRGFNVDHGTDIQVTVDGLPVNMVSHGHGQGYADLHFVIPELVKDIDFGKGPYYSEKGNLNTSGYVSFQTVNSVEDKIQVEAGSFNNYRILGMYNLLPKKNKSANAFIASEYQYFDGPFESPQKFNRFNLFGKYQLSKAKYQFTIISSAFSSKWNASGQIPERAVESLKGGRFGSIDDSEGGYTSRYNVSGKIIAGKKKNFEFQGYYSRYYFNLYSNFTFFARDSINGDQIKQKDDRDILGINTKYILSHSKGKANFKTTIGATFRLDKTFDTELSYTLKRQLLSTEKLGDITESNAALFMDENISIKKWHFNIGARLDQLHFEYNNKLPGAAFDPLTKKIFTPKLNIQYELSKRNKLFLKAGKGFHSNDTRVVLEDKEKPTLPAAYGIDLGFTSTPFANLSITSSVWFLYMLQEFVYVGDEGIVEPSGRSVRYGIDVSARYNASKNLYADIDVNTTRSRFADLPSKANFIPLAPVVTSTGGLTYYRKKCSASLRYRYMSDRPANESNTITAKGYLITDLASEYDLGKIKVGVNVENLFNAKWKEAQFDTESRLQNESNPISEIHFTPGLPLMIRMRLSVTL